MFDHFHYISDIISFINSKLNIKRSKKREPIGSLILFLPDVLCR